MNSSKSRLPFILVVLALLALAAYQGWRYFQPQPVPVTATEAPVTMPASSSDDTASLPADPALVEPPAIENPIEALTPEPAGAEPVALPELADADGIVKEQLATLFSRKDLLTYLQVDGFVRKSVASIDNLARSQAASRLWPVNPTPQRFSTQVGPNGVETIHPANSQRYAPMVRLIESVDSAQAVAVYRGLYPLFQQAYEDLGFPDGYFNDRLVQVLDHLIATPVPAEPPAVTLVEVKGSVPSLRPWVRYEFVDPGLQAQSAGRKILIRMGAANQQRLQAKLKDLRQRVARQ
ncbi:hypothetical protein LPB72_03315 [Hydrogenophaga crassostreae]|uniref:DUF3014 domain-containing protein n=1 Tax=Hydrogenophaga crassostreae TaxID=1763535 RepID=A0A163CN92_9BURK|nr:DUF3014 domain-containing protein [Hydrogenophaga crassostreae]AOW15771.1 hypothetical protein LPB072_17720 [Hydrogenophaga crassostreae]OAD43792.1 hypothetical protein LPB72_03315 [Hydrogenophaga crassostreae]